MNSSKITRKAPDAIALLKEDHRKAKELFEKFEKIKDSATPEQKLDLAKEVCGDLLIHMAIEEAIFYPTVRPGVHDDDLMNEAKVEHDGAKELIHQLGELKPSDPMFDAKMTVLGEQIEHHVKEEESDMFPKARKTKVDMDELGQQLYEAKMQMRTEYGLPAE